jgi:hypothetical protein
VDVLTVLRLVRRWWFLVLPMILVTAGLALLVAQSVPVTYEARGTLLFQPAPVAPPPPDVNPASPTTTRNAFGGAGSEETLAARLMALAITDPSSKDALTKLGAGEFNLKQLTTENTQDLPLIEIDATASTAERAVSTVHLVSDAASRALQEQQAASGVDPAAMITARPLLAEPKAESLYGGRVRAGLAVGSLGFLATLSMPFLMEGLTRNRRRDPNEWSEQLYGAPALPVSREPREPREPARLRD